MNTKRQKRDIAAAKHGMYEAMKQAGVLVNGRMTKRSQCHGDKRKEQSRKACRKGKYKE